MAEGFARRYGSDVMEVMSGGLSPAPLVQPLTMQVMSQKNIDISAQSPKSIHDLDLNSFDVIVNMSGGRLPVGMRAEIQTWNVADPMTQPEEVYIQVRDQIEARVMQLILDLRRKQKGLPGNQPTPAMVRTGPRSTPLENAAKASESSQRFGFGRVRKARD
jgi:arsenate reductase